MEPFKLHTITKDIFLITEPYFYEHANLYLVRGSEHDLLIDCGTGIFDIKAFLQQQGFRPKVVLTHAHFDHAGGVGAFQSQEIVATSVTLKNLKHKELWGLEYLVPGAFDSAATEALAHATPQELCARFDTSAPAGTKPFVGNIITAGNYSFEIIAAPGHSDDSILLYDCTNKLLITGDALYDGELYHHFSNSNDEQLRQTLQMIKALDFDLVLPGHNQVLNRQEALAVIERWVAEL